MIKPRIGKDDPRLPKSFKGLHGGLRSSSLAPRHGQSPSSKKAASPTYRSWASMRVRCMNPNRPTAARYMNRGIKICPEWDLFETFLQDMGERPPNTTLHRVDNDGNYCPENCVWADNKTQVRNRCCSKLTLEDAVCILMDKLGGLGNLAIAAKFGISRAMPSHILYGRSWKEAKEIAMKRIEEIVT